MFKKPTNHSHPITHTWLQHVKHISEARYHIHTCIYILVRIHVCMYTHICIWSLRAYRPVCCVAICEGVLQWIAMCCSHTFGHTQHTLNFFNFCEMALLEQMYFMSQIMLCRRVSSCVCVFVYMYVCMFVCMYVCMCIDVNAVYKYMTVWTYALYLCVYVCAYIYAWLRVCMYVCMYACMYMRAVFVCVCIRVSENSFMFVCMFVCMYACTYAYLSVCMYVGMYMHVYVNVI